MKSWSLVVLSLLTVGFAAHCSAAERTPEQKKALAGVRSALAGRLLEEIDPKVAEAKEIKGDADYEEEVNRLELLAGYVKGFWNAVDKGAQVAVDSGELMVNGKPIAVVEYDRRTFIIRHEGQNRRYNLLTIPAKLAWVCAQQHLKPEVANNKVYFGAFLLMDAKGDRRIAKQQWDEAAAGGADVKFLLPELSADSVAPPVALPDLTPPQRAALALMQWQVRKKESGRFGRDALGKFGQPTAEGRLQVEVSDVEEPALLFKTRIEGNFQCRAFFKDVPEGQQFGLFPAAPSEAPVLVSLPEGTVKVELSRKLGVYTCRINDEDVELKPAEKTAGRLAGFLGVTLVVDQPLVVGSWELVTR